MRDVVGELLAAIESGRGGDADVFTDDVEFDATVPVDWRYRLRGERAVRAKFAEWYGTPSHLLGLRRVRAGDTEVVELDLQTEEDGVPVWAHQVHLLDLRDGLIARDVVLCGGSWTADRMAEIAAAQAEADVAAAITA